MNIYKIISIISIILLLLYCLVGITKFVINNKVSLASDGIRIESQSKYPDTNNPYMEGVTVKEYTAEIK